MTAASPADLTGTGLAVAALAVFVFAYVLVIAEEFTGLRKSKAVVFAAGLIWVLVGVAGQLHGGIDAGELIEHNLLEYAGLLLFLLAAMTYVNTLDERNVFAALRSWMVRRGFSLRSIFWLTGALAFMLSPVLDNLTTALVLGAVALNVGRGRPSFLVPACINIVVAANAGGAFSPFGDITTLMVWQKGLVSFVEFFSLFLPSLVNWLVPAVCMHFAVPRGQPQAEASIARVKPGGFAVMILFASTIAFTVMLHQWLHLPSFLGMMSGLGALMILGHFIRRAEVRAGVGIPPPSVPDGLKPAVKPFDVFISAKRVEWDTLLFFYGVVMCVGGLGALGYLSLLSHAFLCLPGSFHHQCRGRVGLRHHRQHPDHVRRAFHEPGDVPRAVAAGDPYGWCWRLAAVDRLCGGCRPHGPGTWGIHFHGAPEMDLGHRLGLCRVHLGALPGKRGAVLRHGSCSLNAQKEAGGYGSGSGTLLAERWLR